MQRKPNESFAAYKVRRAAANAVTKAINSKSRKAGTISARAKFRETMARFSTGIKGMASSRNTPFGAGLKNRFDGARQ